MTGETNLQVLLRSMTPELDDVAYGIVAADTGRALPAAETFALIREGEGMTAVASKHVLTAHGYDVAIEWARITLKVHSSLEAVGLTAAFAAALGQVGISANVIAGYYHDHIFVQWNKRHAAMSALQALSQHN